MRTLLRPASRLPGSLDVAILVTRVALGFILAACFVTAVEPIGGTALVLGVLTPLAGVLDMVSLLGALVLVHVQSGVFVENGGYELGLALLVGLLVVALQGAGPFSIDGLLSRRVATE